MRVHTIAQDIYIYIYIYIRWEIHIFDLAWNVVPSPFVSFLLFQGGAGNSDASDAAIRHSPLFPGASVHVVAPKRDEAASECTSRRRSLERDAVFFSCVCTHTDIDTCAISIEFGSNDIDACLHVAEASLDKSDRCTHVLAVSVFDSPSATRQEYISSSCTNE